MIVVSFAPGAYTPLPSVSFGAQTAVQADGYGIIEFVGSADSSIINPTPSVAVDFNSSTYTPLPGVSFGNQQTDLSCDGYGIIEFVGSADSQSIVNDGTGYGVLDAFFGVANCHYDINVRRLTSCLITVTQQDANTVTSVVISTQQKTALYLNSTNAQTASASPVGIHVLSALNKTVSQSSGWEITHNQAVPINNTLSSRINLTAFIFKSLCDSKEQAVELSNNWHSVQDALLFLDSQIAAHTEDCSRHQFNVLKDSYQTLVAYIPTNTVSFSQADYTPNGSVGFDNSALVVLLDAIQSILSGDVASPFGHSAAIARKACSHLNAAKYPDPGKSPRIDPPRPPPIPPPGHNGTTLTIPTKTVYTVQHSITVVNQSNQAIPLSKISLSFDVDSYAWQFSGVLADKASLPDIAITNDAPEQLTITINGHVWVMLVESIEQSRSFGKTDITLKGRSLSALLGAPYQPQSSYTAGSDMTVQQIADALRPFDWTIDWQCPTWLVPANAYSHTGQSGLQALASIAGFIGAAIVPSRFEKVLKFQPRYPVLPWHFNAAGITPDLIIPESAVITVNTQSRTQSPINGVYVHGGELGGQLVWCRLNGTAGDSLAPTTSNSLMTDVAGCRALGERVLAGMATQPAISSFTLPFGGDFVLAEVGQLVEVMGERGIINSVAISAEFGKVSQTITIGENTNNAYSKLTALLPHYPLLVGTIVSVYADNAVLTLLDGGVVSARGTGTVGLNYYIRNGLIESAAPNLTLSEIVI